MNAEEKLNALRMGLRKAGVHGFVLPVSDEYLTEYVPPYAQRLAWLTGFTGSAGMAVVLPEAAALFVDGRYTLQAKQEVDARLYTVLNSGEVKPEQWIAQHMGRGEALGYDTWLHSQREHDRLNHVLKRKGIRLQALIPNPADRLWKSRPPQPTGKMVVHGQPFAGETHAAKRKRVGAAIRKAGAEFAIIAAADSVDWLLNIRGDDVPHAPLFRAYALVDASGQVRLYTESPRVDKKLRAHLSPGVELREPGQLEADLKTLAKKRVLADPVLLPAWFFSALSGAGAEIVIGDDPCQLPKALKNAVELEGMRKAHKRDGLALTRFLYWLDQQKGLRESEAAARLLKFRQAAPEFVSPSFETIAGSGPNGAVVHYRVTPRTDRKLQNGELFLLDSGGQYPDGTTDVTRTIAVGKPTAEQRAHFTRVLKGHIAIATVRFPEGTSGTQLDVLARKSLWDAGLDYDHGTGHGVGVFLNVHEGPQRISKRGGDAPLMAGMIISNEPGYYREGKYGIRIESLVAVQSAGKMASGKGALGFETLTCVPLDRRLVEASLLTVGERDWFNTYQAWVLKTHTRNLGKEEKAWLEKLAKPLD